MFYIHYFQDTDIGIDQHIFNLYFNFPGELEFYLFLFCFYLYLLVDYYCFLSGNAIVAEIFKEIELKTAFQ